MSQLLILLIALPIRLKMLSVHLLYTLDLLSTVVFSTTGALLACENGENWLQALLYAVLTALGGGTIRDLLLPGSSVFWVHSSEYLWIAASVGLLTFVLAKFVALRREDLCWADGLGIAVFTVVGVQVGLEAADLSWLLLPILGLLTAMGGGFVRDVIRNKTPYALLHPHCAIASLTGGSLYILLSLLSLPPLCVTTFSIVAVIFVLALSRHSIGGYRLHKLS